VFSTDVGDGQIEVVGLENSIHVAQITAGMQSGRRLAQCSTVVIRCDHSSWFSLAHCQAAAVGSECDICPCTVFQTNRWCGTFMITLWIVDWFELRIWNIASQPSLLHSISILACLLFSVYCAYPRKDGQAELSSNGCKFVSLICTRDLYQGPRCMVYHTPRKTSLVHSADLCRVRIRIRAVIDRYAM